MEIFDANKTYTLDDLEKVLTGSNIGVARQWVQLQTGLIDMANLKPTFEQVDRGLTKTYPGDGFFENGFESWEIARIWISREDYPPTSSQVAEGLSHESSEIRATWIQRHDFKVTEAQATAGFKDVINFHLWCGRPGMNLSEEVVELLLSRINNYDSRFDSGESMFALRALVNNHVQLSHKDIEWLMAQDIYTNEAEARDLVRNQIACLASHSVESGSKKSAIAERKARL